MLQFDVRYNSLRSFAEAVKASKGSKITLSNQFPSEPSGGVYTDSVDSLIGILAMLTPDWKQPLFSLTTIAPKEEVNREDSGSFDYTWIEIASGLDFEEFVNHLASSYQMFDTSHSPALISRTAEDRYSAMIPFKSPGEGLYIELFLAKIKEAG